MPTPISNLREPLFPPAPAELLQLLEEAERGPAGSQRVVLLGDRGAPEGHQRVADVLVQRAALLEHDAGHGREVAIDELHQRLGSHALREGGEPADVAEEHGAVALLPAEPEQLGMVEHLRHHALGHVVAEGAPQPDLLPVGREVADEDHREGGEEHVGQRERRGQHHAAPERELHHRHPPQGQRERDRRLQPRRGAGEHEAEEETDAEEERQLGQHRAGAALEEAVGKDAGEHRRVGVDARLEVPEGGHHLVVLTDQRHPDQEHLPRSASAGSFRSSTSASETVRKTSAGPG